jgi:hypothetical protein
VADPNDMDLDGEDSDDDLYGLHPSDARALADSQVSADEQIFMVLPSLDIMYHANPKFQAKSIFDGMDVDPSDPPGICTYWIYLVVQV